MSKRILAFLCMLAILAGMFVVPATAVDNGTYQVGYSKKDLNPWVAYNPGTGETLGIPDITYTDSSNIIEIPIHVYNGTAFTGDTTTAKFVSIPLSGSSTRPATCMTDDNGDGYIGYGDGIFVTCTSVTDSNGKTVLYMSLDGTNTNANFVSQVREKIVDELGSNAISADQIMVSSSHTHAGPVLSSTTSGAAKGTAYRAYYDYVVSQTVDAAIEAYQSRSAATMSKGEIEASASMADMYGEEYALNFVRHYNATVTLQSSTAQDKNGDGDVTDQNDYTGWTNVGTNLPIVTTAHSGQEFRQFGTYAGQTIYKVKSLLRTGHVSDVDETLYVLKFQRDEGDPIVLINWRAHATMNGGSWNNISSDYINALRYRLENNTKFGGTKDYCVSFWQGAAGNVNGNSSIESENGWRNVDVDEVNVKLQAEVNDSFYSDYYAGISTSYADEFYYTAKYGYLLAKVALNCLDNANMKECAAGDISTSQVSLQVNKQDLSDLYDAYNALPANPTYPFAYEDASGIHVINSKHHAAQIKEHMDSSSSVVNLELNVIALGSNVAMVTIPNEPFDRYSSDYMANNNVTTAITDNDWLDLIGGTYGMPFVLGYSNASYSYLPNALAYDYNTFTEGDSLYGIYGPGSYESNVSPLERGAGEAVIAKLGEMLGTVSDCVATIGGKEYNSLQAAISAYNGEKPIVLACDVTEVTVNKDVVIDLNGYDIEKVTVADGYTLQCMDSQTDDYTIDDNYGYGVIKKVVCEGTGKLAADALGDDVYVMLKEDPEIDENYSFHRVDLALAEMDMQPKPDVETEYNPGVYYTCNFRGDEMVAQNVDSFGIALSIYGEPTNETMDTQCKYSEFTEFEAGEDGNPGNSTLLRGIMKTTNPLLINKRNANFKIYGSAYIKVGDEYTFGACRAPSLKDMFVGNEEVGLSDGVDDLFSTYDDEKQANILKLYETYQPIMKSWDVHNIKAAQDGVLKVLVVGNSHGLDATRMLAEVFETEMPDQEIVVGALYYSGCTISQHAGFMTNGEAEYIYHKNTDGTWVETSEKVTADVALIDENWDYVIMQQASNYAGQEAHFKNKKADFMTVINHIDEKVESDYTLLWNMTWATSDDEDLFATAAENNQTRLAEWYPSASDSTVYDNSVMYNKITEYAQKYIEGDKDLDFLGKDYYSYVIPSATVVQYAHTASEVGDSQKLLYRDYTHMTDYGRLMVGYLWYAKLMGLEKIESVGVGEIPAVLHHNESTVLEQNDADNYVVTDDMRNHIKLAVNWALANPYTVE